MSSLSIVEDFNVVEKVCCSFRPAAIDTPVHTIPFEDDKETFRQFIVITIPSLTPSGDDPVLGEGLLNVVCIWADKIGIR